MPARGCITKPPKPANSNSDLAQLGFCVAESAPGTSQPLMLQGLEPLPVFARTDATAKAYRAAIVDENVLGKRNLSASKETVSRLSAVRGLNPTKPFFRVFRRLGDGKPTDRPLHAWLTQQTCAGSGASFLPLAGALTHTSEEEA